MLLKRHYIQDTTFKEEVLNEGTKYERLEGVKRANDELYKAKEYSKRSRRAKMDDRRWGYSGGGAGGKFEVSTVPGSKERRRWIEGYQNFLA